MAFVHPELLIEPDELAGQLDDPALRLFDATVYKGRLVDIASIKQAEVIVKQAGLIDAGA